MPSRTVTLTTDFGTRDPYAGVMKGVIASLAPNANVIDITHEIEPFNVLEAAYAIAEAYRYFPPKTVHVIVVDPGVGSARRPLLMEATGQFFVAPDNGVLSMICVKEECRVRHITRQEYFLQPVSRTFHGRDVFAPCAARLAAGQTPASFGKRIHDPLQLAIARPARTARRVWTGGVLKVDRFGNLITNFPLEEFQDIQTQPFELQVGFEKLTRLALNFAEGDPGQLLVMAGSSGYLEVAANQASAAKMLGCGVGTPVELTLY